MTIKVSVVLPVYNEGSTIEKVLLSYYKEIGTILPSEIVVCEDGSTDGSKEILLSLAQRVPIKLIAGPQRKGFAKAVKDAVRYVSSDLIFFSDCDGQYDAKDFWSLYKESCHYDMIIGHRIRRQDQLHRIFLSKCFDLLARLFFWRKSARY